MQVRGAYMETERARAAASGSASPVHASAAATHACYDAAAECVLRHQAEPASALVLATHNADSVSAALRSMERLGLGLGHGRIQVRGRCRVVGKRVVVLPN